MIGRRVPCARRAAALAAAGALAVLSHALPAAAQDAAAGKAKAVQTCNVCHGPQGVAVHPEAPHLAGQPAMYLATQLRHYRDSTRKHPVMNVIAQPLTDAEIDNLAAWFASIRVSVEP